MPTEEVKVFKNGKVQVRRGVVTATVDPRKHGMWRWNVTVNLPPGKGYRTYYGPFADRGVSEHSQAITEEDAFSLERRKASEETEDTEEKIVMARKMLDHYFSQESTEGELVR